jgi:hypothetical protein
MDFLAVTAALAPLRSRR